MLKRPSKFDPESRVSCSSMSLFDLTNMTYKPTPNMSMAVPIRNISDQKKTEKLKELLILLLLYINFHN